MINYKDGIYEKDDHPVDLPLKSFKLREKSAFFHAANISVKLKLVPDRGSEMILSAVRAFPLDKIKGIFCIGS